MKPLIAVIMTLLCGCSVISPKVAPQLSKAVHKYCATLSPQERQYVRQQVNEAIKPNEACVYCEGDPGPRCLPTQ